MKSGDSQRVSKMTIKMKFRIMSVMTKTIMTMMTMMAVMTMTIMAVMTMTMTMTMTMPMMTMMTASKLTEVMSMSIVLWSCSQRFAIAITKPAWVVVMKTGTTETAGRRIDSLWLKSEQRLTKCEVMKMMRETKLRYSMMMLKMVMLMLKIWQTLFWKRKTKKKVILKQGEV
jgi:hypothetical protein